MTAIGAAADTLLYLDGVSVSFDGFRALNNLSLVLAPGEMRAVIGPNGAGKTTMMDVITGKTRPASGRVLPVMTSIMVVLPAPFGPITARISPGASTRDRLFSARKPSKLTLTPSR